VTVAPLLTHGSASGTPASGAVDPSSDPELLPPPELELLAPLLLLEDPAPPLDEPPPLPPPSAPATGPNSPPQAQTRMIAAGADRPAFQQATPFVDLMDLRFPNIFGAPRSSVTIDGSSDGS
jgi:hypothetical protein